MKQKYLLAALALALVCSLLPSTALAAGQPGFSNFYPTKTYTPGQFEDVPAAAWYAEPIQTIYELNLMSGVSSTAFQPFGNLTVAEAVALASRIHSIYYGDGAEFSAAIPWYQPYVDYAVQAGIIAGGLDYSSAISRSQFAVIMDRALPAEAFPAINQVTALPDVPASGWYADSIYRLYNAGILSGTDPYGTFLPDHPIQRCEAAALLVSLVNPDQRSTFTLKVQAASGGYYKAFPEVPDFAAYSGAELLRAEGSRTEGMTYYYSSEQLLADDTLLADDNWAKTYPVALARAGIWKSNSHYDSNYVDEVIAFMKHLNDRDELCLTMGFNYDLEFVIKVFILSV